VRATLFNKYANKAATAALEAARPAGHGGLVQLNVAGNKSAKQRAVETV
jgi:hypothetical protein